MKRQAATPKGFKKRVRELQLATVNDPRQEKKVKWPLRVVLSAVVAGLATGTRSLRGVERRTEQIAIKHESLLGISERIADDQAPHSSRSERGRRECRTQ